MYRPVTNNDYSLMVRFDSQPDYVKLRACYIKASQGINDPDAFVDLGDFYVEGLGGPVNKIKARENYMTALNGSWVGFDYRRPLVMAKLGLLYATQGDNAHAYFWLKLMGAYHPYGNTTWTTDSYEGMSYKTVEKAKRTLAIVEARLNSAIRKQQAAAATKWLKTHWPEIPLPPVP